MNSVSNTDPAVALDGVGKVFDPGTPDAVHAVREVSLSISKGEIFSLVGPDGAGKTTLIRMMVGVIPPTSGSIRILGMDMNTQRAEVKRHIGYLSQQFSLYGDLTVSENIDFFAEIHRVHDFRRRKDELLEFTRMGDFRNRLAARLSGGMKQKLALACTLIHTPDIIFLDEPTTGVDPVSRRDFWKILSSLLKSGISIVVSTPYLDEAERSARIALINEGAILTCDSPEGVKASFESVVVEVVTPEVRRAMSILSKHVAKEDLQLFGDRIHVLRPRGEDGERAVSALLAKEHLEARSIRVLQPSLEDVFISRVQPR